MKYIACGVALLTCVLSGCANKPPLCEDILEVKQQEQTCHKLKYQITHNTNPQQVAEARRRYDQLCTNSRYYRNQYDTICKGNEQAIGTPQKQ